MGGALDLDRFNMQRRQKHALPPPLQPRRCRLTAGWLQQQAESRAAAAPATSAPPQQAKGGWLPLAWLACGCQHHVRLDLERLLIGRLQWKRISNRGSPEEQWLCGHGLEGLPVGRLQRQQMGVRQQELPQDPTVPLTNWCLPKDRIRPSHSHQACSRQSTGQGAAPQVHPRNNPGHTPRARTWVPLRRAPVNRRRPALGNKGRTR